MTRDPELERYIDYLQRQLVSPGSEPLLEKQRRWLYENRERLVSQFRSLEGLDISQAERLELGFGVYSEPGSHESVLAREIFSPLLAEATSICERMGTKPNGPVVLASSPGMEPSAAAWPSDGTHVLFAGQGTYVFCNYWSKVFISALSTLQSLKRRECTRANLTRLLRRSSAFDDAIRLALYYSVTGSLVSFGKLGSQENKTEQITRAMLVSSMEIFIISHELAHFTFYEQHPETNGIPPQQSPKELELGCDAIGLSACTVYGLEHENTFATQFIGPLLFFHALAMCEDARDRILEVPHSANDTHPALSERIEFIFEFAQRVNEDRRIIRTMKDSQKIIECLSALVIDKVRGMRDELQNKLATAGEATADFNT